MKSKKYLPTLAVIYLNYLIHGIALIILAQNITYLKAQMNTDDSGVMFVVSGLGIGKLITQYFAGILSDKFGRRPFMFMSILSYILFFGGILFSPNIYVGFAFSFICGFGNTCLDSGGTPALMEILYKMTGTASIITKLFIAAGQFILPMVITIVVVNQLYYGTSFLLCIGILVVLGICLIKVPFVSLKEASEQLEMDKKKKTENDGKGALSAVLPKANFKIEGIALVVIGYTATATFHTVINWITIYSRDVAGMSESGAQSIMSFYSIGAVISVAATAVLVQKTIKPARLLVLYPILATCAISVLLAAPSEIICKSMGFLIGCFAGGGVLQLAAAVIVDFFPDSKGKMTGMVFTTSGIAMFVGPLITGQLSKFSIGYVLVYDIIVTLVGVAMAVIVNIRYNKVFSSKK